MKKPNRTKTKPSTAAANEPPRPSGDDIREALIKALKRVRDEDGHLLEVGVGERALVHRLGVYLERDPLFAGWHVDCEYNRNGAPVPKKLLAALQARRNQGQKDATDLVTPDLIIHRRGVAGPNLLALEAKPKGRTRPKIDLVKLEGFADPSEGYCYAHTAFVSFAPLTLWFDAHLNGGTKHEVGG